MKIILEDLGQTTASHKTATSSTPTKTQELPTSNKSDQDLTGKSFPSTKTLFKTDLDSKPTDQSATDLKSAESTPTLNKKQLNNLISITTSATLGAIPDLAKNSDSPKNCSSSTSLSPYVSQSLFDLQKLCNDEIATVQGLVENKFSRNSNGDFFEKFKLPILRLASNHIETENYFENNMITSNRMFCF